MKSKHLWLLLLILSIAGFLRLYQITTTPAGLYPDEAIGGNQGLRALRTGGFSAQGGPASGWKLFYPENNGRSGLFINLQGLSAGMLGANSPSQISRGETWEGKPWTLRFPSAILGILTVLGLYFLAKELFSERIGLLSAFLLATSFWHINFSRIGFDGIMAPFFLVWSVYFLLKAFRSKSSTSYKLYAVCSGIIYGLGFHSYIAYRVTPVLILFILFSYWRKSGKENLPASADLPAGEAGATSGRRKQFFIVAGCFLLAAFIAALPMGIYFLTHPGDFSNRTSQISVFGSAHPLTDLAGNILKTLAMFNFVGDGNWRHNYSGRPQLFWPVGILFVVGIISGIKSIWQNFRSRAAVNSGENKTFAFLLLFLWFALGAAPAVFSNDGIPHALRSILMAPPVFIFGGVGGIAAYDFLKRRITSFWLPLASIIFLLLFAFEAYNTYFVLWAKNPNVSSAFSADYAELGRTLNELPANVQKYVVVKAGGVLVNGIPMPAQTVMFITDTFTEENQKAKNIYYVLPDQESSIPSGAKIFSIE